jgi:hypothetical protein
MIDRCGRFYYIDAIFEHSERYSRVGSIRTAGQIEWSRLLPIDRLHHIRLGRHLSGASPTPVPIVQALPDRLSLSDCYLDSEACSISPSPSPSISDSDPASSTSHLVVPRLLSDLFALRKTLLKTRHVPHSCVGAIETAGYELMKARGNCGNYQLTHDGPSQDIRDADNPYLAPDT